jgi:hypothetical protein
VITKMRAVVPQRAGPLALIAVDPMEALPNALAAYRATADNGGVRQVQTT